MSERRVAPGLLLAMPQLPDPNFARSVVLMIEHTEDGSWGLIVNRPTQVDVNDVIETLEMQWSGPADAVVWNGGPVTPERGCVLHGSADVPQPEETVTVVPGIVLSTLPDQLRALAAEPPEAIRFLLGYSGWGAGQLEEEMSENAWLSCPASNEVLFEIPFDERVQRAAQSLGIDFNLMSGQAGHA